jgi:HSP20 family protein
MPIQQMLDNFLSAQRPLFSLSNRVWNPPTDVYESGDKTYVKMEISGLDERAIQITAEKNVLVIRGRREDAPAGQQINYHLMEVHYGAFERSFAFSFTLDQDKIKATYERGFLLIELQHTQPTVTRVSVQIINDPDMKQ